MKNINTFLIILILIGTSIASTSCSIFKPNKSPKAAQKKERPSVLKFSDQKIQTLLDTNPKKLGSLSIGYPYAGALFNSAQMPKSKYWEIINPRESWATQETINYLTTSIKNVHKQFPNSPKIYIGDISDKNGGWLGRHISHQSGRDVDLGWYYKNGSGRWWKHATRHNLDVARTWALIRTLFTETDVELILINRSVQKMLYQYAMGIGEDPEWLNNIFQYPGWKGSQGIIRHARGHSTHMHIRFYNPEAQEMGRRTYPYLVKKKIIKPPRTYVYHSVRSGQTLGHLAARYRTSVSAIKRANGLRSSLIRAGRRYKIPQRMGVKVAAKPIDIPPRKLPPPIAANEKTSPPISMLKK